MASCRGPWIGTWSCRFSAPLRGSRSGGQIASPRRLRRRSQRPGRRAANSGFIAGLPNAGARLRRNWPCLSPRCQERAVGLATCWRNSCPARSTCVSATSRSDHSFGRWRTSCGPRAVWSTSFGVGGSLPPIQSKGPHTSARAWRSSHCQARWRCRPRAPKPHEGPTVSVGAIPSWCSR